MKINIAAGSKSFSLNILDESADVHISTLGELRTAISDAAELDPSVMKIIHRGKTLNGADSISLLDFGIKENDKMIVMGRGRAPQKVIDDPGFLLLLDYEKKNLLGLQKKHEEIEADLTELEKKFLEGDKLKEMAKQMDKRLKTFNEISIRHLESIDGLPIIREDTSADQATRNREKRKSLITGIQTLLNSIDRFVRRLEEFNKKLAGEIVE